MYNETEIIETIKMIQEQNLDVRTITMGISLIDCMDTDIKKSCEKVYNKIYNYAKDLVKVGNTISKKYGIPIINKRVAVTPISMLVGVSGGNPVEYAKTFGINRYGVLSQNGSIKDVKPLSPTEHMVRDQQKLFNKFNNALELSTQKILKLVPRKPTKKDDKK